MRYAVFALALFGPNAVYGQDQLGETCNGTETVSINGGASKVHPYTLDFSVDLATGYYCYAECKPDQTYAIKNRNSDPIKLGDTNGGPYERLITFDRKTSTLTDHQIIKLVGRIETVYSATCRTSTFHEPTPLPVN